MPSIAQKTPGVDQLREAMEDADDVSRVSALLAAGVDPAQTDQADGRNGAHWAAIYEREKCLTLLLPRVDPNQKDGSSCQTLLDHVLEGYSSVACLEVLLRDERVIASVKQDPVLVSAVGEMLVDLGAVAEFFPWAIE